MATRRFRSTIPQRAGSVLASEEVHGFPQVAVGVGEVPGVDAPGSLTHGSDDPAAGLTG